VDKSTADPLLGQGWADRVGHGQRDPDDNSGTRGTVSKALAFESAVDGLD